MIIRQGERVQHKDGTQGTIESFEQDGHVRVLWDGWVSESRYDKAYFAANVSGIPDDKPDAVNHPSHYTSFPGIEVIDLVQHLNFCKGNAVKYLARAGLKDPSKEIEDLRKALWYVEREIARVEALSA